MRLGGRMAAAIEVLTDIEARKRPVADALKDWGLAHRFAGSGDRAAIGNLVYDALRMRLSHAWLMDSESEAALVYAVLLRQWGYSPETLSAELADDKFAPEAPDLSPLATRNLSDAPAHVQGDLPDWVQPSFQAFFGDSWLAEAQGMATRPTLDLRANTLKANRDKVVKALDRSGAMPSPITPNGIRIPAGSGPSRLPNVTAEVSFEKGWFEVQDEGSQIVSDLIRPAESAQFSITARAAAARHWRFRRRCTTRVRSTPMTPTASGWRRSSSDCAAPARAMCRCMTIPAIW